MGGAGIVCFQILQRKKIEVAMATNYVNCVPSYVLNGLLLTELEEKIKL